MKNIGKKQQRLFALATAVVMIFSIIPITSLANTVGIGSYSTSSKAYIDTSANTSSVLNTSSNPTSSVVNSSEHVSVTSKPTSSTESVSSQPSSTRLEVYKTGWPITNRKITFEIMGRFSVHMGDPQQMSMFSYMEKNTNVAIKYIPVSENKIKERKILAIQSGDMPDAFAFTYDTFSDFEIDKYSRNGAIVDVSEYLEEYAPTIYAELENHPIQKALNVTSDGKIYTLPSKTPRSDYTNYDHFLNINKRWLDELGLDIPKTTTEFLEVMRAFRDQDPNGNGQCDEVPFALWNWGASFVLSFWGSHVGAGNLAADLDGKVYYPLTTPNAKAACEWWHDFLNEPGLMDGYITGRNNSGSWEEFASHIRRGNVGCFQWSYLQPDRFPSELLKDYVAIPYPTANFRNLELNLSSSCQPYNSDPQRGKIIITKACSNVPALLRYFDYLYTDDGIMVGNYGDPAEGLYEKLENGNYKLTEKGMVANAGFMHAPGWLMALPETTAMIDIKLEEATTSEYTIYKNYVSRAKETYRKANLENPQIRLSALMLTSDEIIKLRKFTEEFASSGTAGLMSYYIQSYDNALNNWVTDVQEMEAKGLNEYVKLYQGVVDRNHQYVLKHSESLTQNVAATCTEDGYKTYVCSCGDTRTEIIKATGHHYTAVVTKPTCTSNGFTTHTCSNCGNSYTSDEIVVSGHDYKSVETAPSCESDGFVKHTCAVCGDSYITDEIKAFGHDYKTVVIAPTCTEKGYSMRVCSTCGDEIIDESSYVSASGHRWKKGEVIAPTCTQQGYTSYVCSGCGEINTRNFVDALGHNYTTKRVEPTCAEDGYIAHVCENCGDEIREILTAIGHFWVEIEEIKATCISKGYILYECDNCKETLKDNFTDTAGHSYVSTVTLPTATAQGYTLHTCTACGHNYKTNYTDATGTVNGVQNMKVTASDTNIIVTWDTPKNISKYNLYVKNENGETLITRELAADRTSATLSWPSELEWDKNYTIGIRAKTTRWLDTVWKDAALVVGNRIVDVKTQSVGRTIKVDWRAYDGATQYYVYVYKKGAYSEGAITSVKATTNTVTIINAINPEIDYEVRVIATKGVAKMKTADALSIDARLNVFTPDIFTERGITPDKVAVSWDEVRGADKYWVYLTPVGGGAEIIKESTKAIAAVAGLAPNTAYTVQIQARITDADGKTHYSGKSAVLGTIITSDWDDVNFAAEATAGGAKLSWIVPANAKDYTIYRSTNGGRTFKKIITISDSMVSSYTDTAAKKGYYYGLIVKYNDDYVTTKSKMFKSELTAAPLFDVYAEASSWIYDIDQTKAVPLQPSVEDEYLSDAMFVGDSITTGIDLYGISPNSTVISCTGINTSTILTSQVIKSVGEKVTFLQAMKKYNPKHIYVMLGINGVHFQSKDTFISGYSRFIDAVKAQHPNSTIYIQSILPVSAKKSSSDTRFKNSKIDEYNNALLQLASEKDVYYINVAEAFKNEHGDLMESLDSGDGIHFTTTGYRRWMEYIKRHTVPTQQNEDWRLLIVNRQHPLTENYEVNVDYVSDNYRLDSRIINDYNQMISDAKNAGVPLTLISAFRTYESQVTLFNNRVNQFINKGYSREEAEELAAQYVAPPGTSEHLTGLAVDLISPDWYSYNSSLNIDFENTKQFGWLYNNCANYGFILRYPKDKESVTGYAYEPWHYRYVGVEAAMEIMDKVITLEEYVSTIK